jgi:hypothetical protein
VRRSLSESHQPRVRRQNINLAVRYTIGEPRERVAGG